MTQTLATLPFGSTRNVLRAAIVSPRISWVEPYCATTFFCVSDNSLKVRLCSAQNSLWLSVESTLTPKITVFFLSYCARSLWKLCASMVQPGVLSFG